MDTFHQLTEFIRAMGHYASENQKKIEVSYKDDGSVLTETDTYINTRVKAEIARLFPGSCIITEEENSSYDEKAPFTFILDPIDGTDSYSQGMPAWCISLGIIDSSRKTVGAIIYAPRWGLGGADSLLLTLFPSEGIHLNGKPYETGKGYSGLEQVAMGSHIQHYVDLTAYRGKIRSFGSNILHMIAPLIHPRIQGSISVPCFVWDVAGAHALLSYAGYPTVYRDGEPFAYTDSLLKERKPFRGILFSGQEEAVEEMRSIFR